MASVGAIGLLLFAIAAAIGISLALDQQNDVRPRRQASQVPPLTPNVADDHIDSEQSSSSGSGSEKSEPIICELTPREFVAAQLDELLRFRETDSFSELGFIEGGPHHGWLMSVRSQSRNPKYNDEDRYACRQLYLLGQEYLRTEGRETETTTMLRQRIADYLATG